MDQYHIFPAFFMLELPDCLQEGLAFNIAYCAAHLDDGNFCIFGSGIAVKTALDLVGDVWDHLNGSSAKISPALLL